MSPILNVSPDRLQVGQIINVSWEEQGKEGHLKVTTPAWEMWYGASFSGSLSIPATVSGPMVFELRGPERKALRTTVRKTVTIEGDSVPAVPQAPPTARGKKS